MINPIVSNQLDIFIVKTLMRYNIHLTKAEILKRIHTIQKNNIYYVHIDNNLIFKYQYNTEYNNQTTKDTIRLGCTLRISEVF